VDHVMRRASADVVVFIDRALPPKPRRVLLAYSDSAHDQRALLLAARLAKNSGAELTLLHVVRPGSPHRPPVPAAQELVLADPATGGSVRINTIESLDPVATVIRE